MKKLICLAVFLGACGSTHKVKGGADIGGEVQVKIVMTYPQAEQCFTSPLVNTFEKLKECLELTTDQSFSIDVNGEIVDLKDLLKDGVENATSPAA